MQASDFHNSHFSPVMTNSKICRLMFYVKDQNYDLHFWRSLNSDLPFFNVNSSTLTEVDSKDSIFNPLKWNIGEKAVYLESILFCRTPCCVWSKKRLLLVFTTTKFSLSCDVQCPEKNYMQYVNGQYWTEEISVKSGGFPIKNDISALKEKEKSAIFWFSSQGKLLSGLDLHLWKGSNFCRSEHNSPKPYPWMELNMVGKESCS